MRVHMPIVQTAAAAALAIVLIGIVETPSLFEFGPIELAFFLAGLLYTQLFEYVAHRLPMHRRIRFLEGVRLSHLKHHRVFHGSRFRTRDGSELEHIAGRYWIFPVLLGSHYLALRPFLPPNALVAFLTAATLHYVSFEISHWFTHLEDNAFDRWLARVPVVARLRAYQVEHHRLHHEIPEMAFNFSPPYLGDVLTGRMPRHATAIALGLDLAGVSSNQPAAELAPVQAAPDTRARLWRRRRIRLASAVLAGAAVVGIALLARSRLIDLKTLEPQADGA